MTPRQPLFAKYAALITALAGAVLLAGGATEIHFSHRQHRATLAELQRDKSAAAASSVSRFLEDLAQQIGWSITPASSGSGAELEKWRVEYLKLLRVAPAVTTLRLADSRGRERLRVSRLDADRKGDGADLSGDAGVVMARAGRVHFSPIYFFEQTEPYITVAVPNRSNDGSVTLAEVNLKFIWTVVTEIKIGVHGYAYVVDGSGRLVAHPEISRVLQMTDMSVLPQVRAALAQRAGSDAPAEPDENAIDVKGRPVLSNYAAIQATGWLVFVEQPRSEALAPMYDALFRTAAVLLLALGLALLASLVLARAMVSPIRRLQAGARQIGAGDLGHRIHVNTGDELQELAEQFNRMGEQVEGSYADLERRIAERTRDLETANLAKSRFLAAASHDLRQPIHALSLLAVQLRSPRCPADRNEIVAQIQAGIAGLSNLFDDLLDISKLEAGAVAAQREEFAVAGILGVIDSQFALLAAEKGIKFRVRRNHALVCSDPVLLQRILSNLVSNAVRYTERGGVLVGCRRRGPDLRIAVWDTGCGIPEDRREDIFREFVQLDSPGRDRGKGLGLGLAIVARLAPLLGGRVELRSIPGRGSVFAIGIPLAAARDERAAGPPPCRRGRTQDAALRGVFAVVVDDDERACAALQRLLTDWGCVTLGARGGSDALAALAQHDRAPELLICDYHLGSAGNGVDVIRLLRGALGGPIPAILITGDASQEVPRTAAHHQLPVLLKPVAPAKLRALMSRLLEEVGDTHADALRQNAG